MAINLTPHIAISTLGLLLFFTSSGYCIRCWDCNSNTDPKCADPFDNSTVHMKDCEYSTPLAQYPNVKSTMCRKIRQKVNGKWRYFRDCAYLGEPGIGGDERYCLMRTGTHNIFVEICTCASRHGWKLLRKCNSECYAQNIKFIVRQIKEKHLGAKFVLDAIKNTFHDRNHHVGRFSCVILSTCVENCGLDMNDSRTRNEYLKQIKGEILKCPHPDIRIQALITLQKWEHCYGQYSIFEKGERYCFDDAEGVGSEGGSKKRRERKKNKARNGSIRRPKTPYQLYMKIKTQMLYGAKKGLHMKRKDMASSSSR